MAAGLLLALIGGAEACEDLGALVGGMEQQVLALEPARALELLEQGEDALACQPVADPELLARMWIAAGLADQLSGRDGSGYFKTAHHTLPTYWSPAFPEDMRPSTVSLDGSGTLGVHPVPSSQGVWLNGAGWTPPGPVPAGRHLVQVAPDDGAPTYTRFVVLTSGESLDLSTGLREPVPVLPDEDIPLTTEPLPVVEPPAQRFNRPLVAAALGTAALSGASAGLALKQNGDMRAAPDKTTLDQELAQQKGWAATCYGAAGASAVLLGASVVF